MHYIDLFGGIGGFSYGIKKTTNSNRKWQCVGYYDNDKYAVQTYNKNFRTSYQPTDIKTVSSDKIPDHDLLIAGFPCQSFSIAGKRKGFNDTRGTLFFEIARIARDKKPKYLLLENVKGLLNHDKGKTFATILETLSELGYSCEWQVLNSKNFGVPQNRERVFIIGYLGGFSGRKVFPIGEGNKKNNETSRQSDIARTITTAHAHSSGFNMSYIKQINQPKHSNNRVYGTGGLSPTLNTAQGGNRQPFIKINEATKKGYAVAEEGDSINLSVPNSKTRRGRVGKGIAHTLDTGMQQYTLQKSINRQPFIAAERGRYKEDGTTEQRLEARKDNVSNTLISVEKDNRVVEGLKIRRLTPIECERLQGFPDDWTAGVSDTQRYKQLGNAVTTNVVQAIITRMKGCLNGV